MSKFNSGDLVMCDLGKKKYLGIIQSIVEPKTDIGDHAVRFCDKSITLYFYEYELELIASRNVSELIEI